MRKLFLGVFILLLISGCKNNKQDNTTIQQVKQNDSVAVAEDTLDETVSPVEETVIPPTADETFADFFYSFSTSKKMQMSRIKFPLPLITDSKDEKLDEKQWKFDAMFSKLPVYTVIYEKESDMDLEKSTSIKQVKVDWVYLKNRKLKRYDFKKENGLWTLEAVNISGFKEDTEKENFYNFYYHFANDTIFQQERLMEPLKFVTVDPDDEFQILDTTLEPGQWFAFKPELPKGYLTNVIYGQSLSDESDKKIIEIKGFGNGYNNTLYFERHNGKWKLAQFEDLSD